MNLAQLNEKVKLKINSYDKINDISKPTNYNHITLFEIREKLSVCSKAAGKLFEKADYGKRIGNNVLIREKQS